MSKKEIGFAAGAIDIKEIEKEIDKFIQDISIDGSGGKKNDSKKPRLDLVPTEFTVGVAKALTFGAKKYGDHNFREGINFSRLLGAAKRHLELELAGVDIDEDSGMEHWQLAAASLAMYSFMKAHKPELNDLYKYNDEEKQKLVELMYGDGE